MVQRPTLHMHILLVITIVFHLYLIPRLLLFTLPSFTYLTLGSQPWRSGAAMRQRYYSILDIGSLVIIPHDPTMGSNWEPDYGIKLGQDATRKGT